MIVRKQITEVRAKLEEMEADLTALLPKTLPFARLMRSALTVLRAKRELLNCSRSSLYSAIVTAANLGLELDGVLGQGYLVPFKGRVQFIPGYRGLIALARNSGQVKSILAREVVQGDDFEYEYGTTPFLRHRPLHDAAEQERPVVGFYAVATLATGGVEFEYLPLFKVFAIRDRSPGAKRTDSPWNHRNDWIEMGRKTALRKICKTLPVSRVQAALAVNDAYDSGRAAEIDGGGDVQVLDITDQASAGDAILDEEAA